MSQGPAVGKFSDWLKDPSAANVETRRRMEQDPDSDWHLKEWAALQNKRQADLTRDLGWLPPRASKVWNGEIPYKRDIVVALAQWLGIRPHELLMLPRDAMALRRLRETAKAIAAETEQEPFEGPASQRKSG